MTDILVPGPVMTQERMNICQNTMSAPRLLTHLYTFRYTNIIITLYIVGCLLFTERLVNDLLKITQHNFRYIVENMYMSPEQMQKKCFILKLLYLNILLKYVVSCSYIPRCCIVFIDFKMVYRVHKL